MAWNGLSCWVRTPGMRMKACEQVLKPEKKWRDHPGCRCGQGPSAGQQTVGLNNRKAGKNRDPLSKWTDILQLPGAKPCVLWGARWLVTQTKPSSPNVRRKSLLSSSHAAVSNTQFPNSQSCIFLSAYFKLPAMKQWHFRPSNSTPWRVLKSWKQMYTHTHKREHGCSRNIHNSQTVGKIFKNSFDRKWKCGIPSTMDY